LILQNFQAQRFPDTKTARASSLVQTYDPEETKEHQLVMGTWILQ